MIMTKPALQHHRRAGFVMITRFLGAAAEHPHLMAEEDDDVTAIAGRGSSDLASGNQGSWPHEDPDDEDKDASAERMAAAARGADDPADASAGDAAGVPVPSEDAVAGSSEAFPPVNS
jgi:hypothetical protein